MGYMAWELLGIPIGIVLLYLGSEWMVTGAKKMAFRLGVTPFVIGLTVVAFGSSAPETITSLVSTDNPQIILGNIVGSNIANVGLAIGLAALVAPVVCGFHQNRFEMYSMMFSVLLITAMALTGSLGTIEGIVLVALLFVFVYLVYRFKNGTGEAKDEELEKEATEDIQWPIWKSSFFVVLGIVILYFGAKAFIAGSVELAGIMGVSDLMIGLLVVAVGTSLPELCICIMAAKRHENELVVSNIVGSITFNCFFALGIGVVFTTVPITHYMMIFHMPVMILMAAVLFAMIRYGNRITRPQAAVLLVMYVVYVALMAVFPELTEGVM